MGLVSEIPHRRYVSFDFWGIVESLVLPFDDLLGVCRFQVYQADLGGEEAFESAEQRTLDRKISK